MVGRSIRRIKWTSGQPLLVLRPDLSTTAPRQTLPKAAHEFEHLVGVILDPDAPVDIANRARLVDNEGAPFDSHVLFAIQLFLLVDSIPGCHFRLGVG